MRIQPNRPGYAGYGCDGADTSPIPPMPCACASDYGKIPPTTEGCVVNVEYEDLSALEKDVRLDTLSKACDISYDPFKGSPIDLYRGFIENGLGSHIPSLCYDSDDIDPDGILRPFPMGNIVDGCGDIGGGA